MGTHMAIFEGKRDQKLKSCFLFVCFICVCVYKVLFPTSGSSHLMGYYFSFILGKKGHCPRGKKMGEKSERKI